MTVSSPVGRHEPRGTKVAVISFVERLRSLAAAEPDRPSVTDGFASLSRSELVEQAAGLARALRAAGVEVGDFVSMPLPNGADWFVALVATWMVGATPQPLNPRMPERERVAVLDLADPKVVVATDPGLAGGRTVVSPQDRIDDGSPLPEVISPAWKAPTSGGSTGRPKLILSGDPASMDTDLPPGLLLGMPEDGCLVMPGPLFHNGPLVWSVAALMSGMHVVVLERFDPERTLAAMAEHRADVVYLVPTMMKRIWRLPTEVRESYDLSNLKLVWHLAEPCPAWLKEAWIDWLGPERIIELYAGTEAQLSCIISGPEWLAHKGSVGKPLGGELSVRDPDGNPLPPGQEGELWMKSARATPSYTYIGATARRSDDGWESLGDMGWLDEEGYLYLGDRSSDMVLVGGSNVYPAEVEGALGEHPEVRSCAVIGLPDEDKGNRIHAIVEADPDRVSAEELGAFVADRLAGYKRPSSYEFTDAPLRDDAGKVRRSELRAARLPG
jgi:bile acid-coenzyme A ligase